MPASIQKYNNLPSSVERASCLLAMLGSSGGGSLFLDMEEIWKDVVGYEGLYQISNLGGIKSLGRKIKNSLGIDHYREGAVLKPINNRGYLIICLCNKNVIRQSLHRLVAIAFIPNPENKRTVNHINGIKNDNRLANLEWATYSENLRHSFRVLGRKPCMNSLGKTGKLHIHSKPVTATNIKTGEVKYYESANSASKDGFESGNISACCHNKIKTHKGYKWEFAPPQTTDNTTTNCCFKCGNFPCNCSYLDNV